MWLSTNTFGDYHNVANGTSYSEYTGEAHRPFLMASFLLKAVLTYFKCHAI